MSVAGVNLPRHLDLIATAPDGIPKLRGLILELAVRGKLVPQDPNDEPASELLKRIAKERVRLEAEGTGRKSRATPVVADEWPFDLPERWKWCRLPDVASYRMGKTPPTKDSAYWADNGIPWVSISDMIHGERVLRTSRTVSDAARERIFRSSPAPAGTLLMSFKLTVGKVATLGMDAFHNEAIISIFPFRGVSQEFLTHFLPMIAQGGNSKNALMGDTLNSESLALLAIPLPPLAEQHRIVAKVDELMALYDRLEAEQVDAGAAHARLVATLLGTLTQSADAAELAANWQRLAGHFDTLFTTESSLDALKQTILQLAVMGKLVPQDPNDEPASKLLKRIAQERARLEAEGPCRKLKPVLPVGDEEQAFSLPSGWKWSRFSAYAIDVSTGPFGSMLHQSDYVLGGIPLVNPSHMIGGRIVPEAHVAVAESKAIELSNYRLRDGDIVMARRGEVGRTAVVTRNEDGWLCGTGSFVIRLASEAPRRFIVMLFRAASVRRYLGDEAVGTTMVNLNHGILNNMPVAIPSVAEQHRIVAKVDELLALVDRLKADLAESRRRQERLASTLIDSALAAA